MVAVDAVRSGGFGVAAGSALVHKGHFDFVLLWVEHIGAEWVGILACCHSLVDLEDEGDSYKRQMWGGEVGRGHSPFATKLRPDILPHVVLLLGMTLSAGARSVHCSRVRGGFYTAVTVSLFRSAVSVLG